MRGEQLAGLGGCVACHTAPEGAPLAGGYPIQTRFGTFYGPNLTPDPEHGLGAWSFDDFRRAMREGHDPNGRPYWPAFPYDAFTQVTDADLSDLWAWLSGVPPVARPDDPHALAGAARLPGARASWRGLAFREGPRPPDPSDPVDRGRYLAEGLGHCGGCHTPRSSVGVPSRRRALAGSDDPAAPNITPHADGIGGWSAADVVDYLESGMTPDGDVAGGEMRRVIREGTSALSDADRQDLAAWLLAQRPVADRP